MNNQNTQQPQLNITKYLKLVGMMTEANILLTNGGNAPIPRKLLNQRQKRKLYRQTHN